MPTVKKIEAVEAMKQELEGATGAVLADFTGLGVEKMNDLRRKCRDGDTRFVVVKNTLAKLALAEAGIEGLDGYLEGPTGWAITTEDAVAPAKILSDFAKENELPKIKAGIIDGSVCTADQVGEVANLPSKLVLVAQIAGLINSPMQGLATGINAVMGGLAIAIDEIRKKKEAGEVPAE